MATPEGQTIEWLMKLSAERLTRESSWSSVKVPTCQIASQLLNRGLCRVNDTSTLLQIAKESWALYAHGGLPTQYSSANESTIENLNPCLYDLVKFEPSRSFLKPSLSQVMTYILNSDNTKHLEDLKNLIKFINELKGIFDTVCDEDRQLIRKRNSDLANVINKSTIDASVLIYWALNETAKYCLCQKFSPFTSTNQYLGFLKKEIAKPFNSSDKLTRKFLVALMSLKDKLIQDRISNSSIPNQTFMASPNIEEFYKLNCTNFQSWSMKYQQPLAKLSLIVDDPAECWRIMNLRLFADLEIKYSNSSSASFSRTLDGLNKDNWHKNILFMALAAKQLGDIDLLYGIRSMEYIRKRTIDMMIANLEGDYDTSYKLFNRHYIGDTDQQEFIEFFESCSKKDKLKYIGEFCGNLESPSVKAIYEFQSDVGAWPKLNQTHLRRLEEWLTSWQDLNDEKSSPLPSQAYIDIVVPTCLNMITKVPDKDKQTIIELTENFLSHDFLSQSLFPPNHVNINNKIYYILLNCLKNDNKLMDKAIIEAHKNDYRWNFELYRHLCNLKLTEQMRPKDKTIDEIEYRAAKFNLKIKNKKRAKKIINVLYEKTGESDDLEYDPEPLLKTYLISTKIEGLDASINKFSAEADFVPCDSKIRAKIYSKLMNHLSLIHYDLSGNELHHLSQYFCSKNGRPCKEHYDDRKVRVWKHFADHSDLSTRVKSMVLIAKHIQETYSSDTSCNETLNSMIYTELELLKCLTVRDRLEHKSIGIESLSRLIRLIGEESNRISSSNFVIFKSSQFLEATRPLWLRLKRSLISMITNNLDLSHEWRLALIDILKSITRMNPESFIYDVLVNRLEAQKDPIYLSPSGLNSNQPGNEYCCRLWDELYDIIKSCGVTEDNNGGQGDKQNPNWTEIVLQTERFIKEIRKISYLPQECLKSLTLKIPRRLANLLENYNKHQNRTLIGKIEFQRKLAHIRENELKSLKVLTGNYDGTKPEIVVNFTLEEMKFHTDFKVYLKELEYRLTLLVDKKPLPMDDLDKLIQSINELLAKCRAQITLNESLMRQTHYMIMISPVFSRLKPSSILMPSMGDLECSPYDCIKIKPLVTIHSISQTIQMIHSKTCPKKLNFIGSDGKARSFLLKAHEDLRLDQLFMDLFHSLNIHFAANKETRDKFRLRSYSVTPVSSRSGLIQWIDAKALSSFLRTWLCNENGKKAMESIYKDSCAVLCDNVDKVDDQQAKQGDNFLEGHEKCQPPKGKSCLDVFHQMLWVELKKQNHHLAQTRPSAANTTKIKSELGHSMFIQCVEQMMSIVPKDFVSNQLWFSSCNSHEYYMKTKRYIHSTAAMSMVGHIIGLGDRHTDNILLDNSTGELIHIDYNISFEAGHKLSVPEKVPFRLTPNIIHAMGFAGLEGGFKRSCERVLSLLRDKQVTTIVQLSYTNLGFMIQQDDEALEESADLSTNFSVVLPQNKQNINNKVPMKMEIFSQESIDEEKDETTTTTSTPRCDVTNLLVLNNADKTSKDQTGASMAKAVEPTKAPQTDFYLQDQIKTPDKMSSFVANQIHDRLKEKLTGFDEFWLRRAKKYLKKKSFGEHNARWALSSPSRDLIELDFDGLSVEDEVYILMMEAVSLENKAAMFEGWLPWL